MTSNLSAETTKHSFKKCSCGFEWFSREAFLRDRGVELIGYQVDFRELELGLFLFNHNACETTMAAPAGYFRDLHDGPVFSDPIQDTDQCPDYCRQKTELRPCPEKCECGYVREILQKIVHWPKVDSP